MIDFIREGGFPMLVILALGLLSVGMAVRFAVRPHDQGVALVRALATATMCASVAGFAAGVAAVGHGVGSDPEWQANPELGVVIMGIAEALANPILGFLLAAVAWVGVAVGVTRLSARS